MMDFAPVSALFQSTRPVRGATIARRTLAITLNVSIHAPRAGRDNVISLSCP